MLRAVVADKTVNLAIASCPWAIGANHLRGDVRNDLRRWFIGRRDLVGNLFNFRPRVSQLFLALLKIQTRDKPIGVERF